MRHVEGVVQHYAWGDPEFLPALLGIAPDGRPWAELWLGTHPNGPATVDGRPLSEVAGPLPYLLKVLAAAEPLSLQAHPTRAQAAAGFAAGRYPDDQPKPELLVALTRFEALCGFRPIDDALGPPRHPRGAASWLRPSATAARARRCTASTGGASGATRSSPPAPDRSIRRRGGPVASGGATPVTPAWPPRCCSTT